MKLAIAYVVIAAVVWPFTSGMFYSYLQAIWSDRGWQAREARGNAGFAIAFGALYAALWPVCLPAAYCLTGFAEHGVWNTYPTK